MNTFSVNLIEANQKKIFTVDSSGRKHYSFTNLNGILRRKYDGSWTSSAIELDSPKSSKNLITMKEIPKFTNIPVGISGYDAGKILDENRYLLDFLDSRKVAHWQVDFRYHRIDRIIINNRNKVVNSNFNHYSILVKIRIDNQGKCVEVGEGNPGSMKFNLSGLALRIKEILNNHKKSKKMALMGQVPVVLNSGDGGILFHEILGHSLEADHIYQRMSSVTPGDIGRRIVSRNVTLFTRDRKDPFFGNLLCDDEGETTDASLLVEKGVLRNFISDFFYQKLLRSGGGGHCRLQDFRKIPMPRMYALYLQPGPYDAEELIDSVDFGIFAKEPGGGKVFFNKNLFYFDIKAAYLIERGKITEPLGSIIVRGNITDALNSVEMIANDFCYDKGISYCHKNGQTVNVRVGQPTVKINNLYVSRGYHD
jgi:predicted Zn-dependent protease